jgi:5'-methylthioadenosine phosphorylase
MSTDYDCWKVEEEAVTVETVVKNMSDNAKSAKNLLFAVLPDLEKAIESDSLEPRMKGTIKIGSSTDKEKRNKEMLDKLEYILPGYFS